MIVMPSSLEDYFESLAVVTEPLETGGAGLSVEEFNNMMPWHLDVLLDFKVSHRNKGSKPPQED